MVTKCYNLVNSIACGMILAEIAQHIRYYINYNGFIKLNECEYCEIEITCEEADLPFVERMLAEFV